MSRRLLLGLTLALGCAFAAAHETQPADWCPAGTHPVVIAEFRIPPADLAAYQQLQTGQATGSTPGCDPKTCGIVDQWFWANDMATDLCGGAGLRGAAPEEAIPFVESPESFNHKHHHDHYRFEQGPLIGQCVVCRTSEVPAAPPPRTDE